MFFDIRLETTHAGSAFIVGWDCVDMPVVVEGMSGDLMPQPHACEPLCIY